MTYGSWTYRKDRHDETGSNLDSSLTGVAFGCGNQACQYCIGMRRLVCDAERIYYLSVVLVVTVLLHQLGA